MKFLIPTKCNDTSAVLIKLALEERGHAVTLFYMNDWPTRQTHSVLIENKRCQWKNANRDCSWLGGHYDVIWWRPFSDLAEENSLFFEALLSEVAPHAWWVNNKEATRQAQSKLLQLTIANHCGLSIPSTLCSNDPKEIRRFIAQYQSDGIIFKSNSGSGEERNISHAMQIDFLKWPQSKLLQLTPSVFQKDLKEKHRLRSICFGDYIVTAKIGSALPNENRPVYKDEIAVEPYKLSDEVEGRIKLFMKKIGLVFCSLEFVVTPNNDIVFVEIGDPGEFLWIEEKNPGFKMLDIFVNFLLERTSAFRWKPNNLTHEIKHYKEESDWLFIKKLERHVNPNCNHY